MRKSTLHHKVSLFVLLALSSVFLAAVEPSIGAWKRQSPERTIFLPFISLERVIPSSGAEGAVFTARLLGLERGNAYVVSAPYGTDLSVSGGGPLMRSYGRTAALFIAPEPEALLRIDAGKTNVPPELALRGCRIRSLPDASLSFTLQLTAVAFLAFFSMFRSAAGFFSALKTGSWRDEAFYALAAAASLPLIAAVFRFVSSSMLDPGFAVAAESRLRSIGGIAFLVFASCGMASVKPFRGAVPLACIVALAGAAAIAGAFLPFLPESFSLAVFSAGMVLIFLVSSAVSFHSRRGYIGFLSLSAAAAAAALLASCVIVDPLWESALSGAAALPFLLLSLRPRISLGLRDIPEPVLSDYVDQVSIALTRFVPKEFLAILDKSKATDLQLGDHVKKNMTIFFSDIRAFTSLSETLTPEENFRFINSYLSRVVPVVNNFGGFVDKYIGDAIMALFPDGKGADSAVGAAIEMQRRIREYNVHRESCGYRQLSMGIGIHTGALMLGVVGVKDRMQSTVISDAVNLASRLESITKVFNVSLAISEETFKSLADPGAYMYRFIGKVRVKGKTDPVSVFEIFDGIDESLYDRKMRVSRFFEQAMLCYYQKDFHGAMFYFRKVLEILPEDGASAFYLDNCLAKVRL